MAHRYTVVFSFFILGILSLFFLSYSRQVVFIKKEERIFLGGGGSSFQGHILFQAPLYFQSWGGEPRLSFQAESSRVEVGERGKVGKDMDFLAPRGIFFQKNGQKVSFEAGWAHYESLGEEDFLLDMEKGVSMDFFEVSLKGQKALYRSKTGHFSAEGEIETRYEGKETGNRLQLTASFLEGWLFKRVFHYRGEVRGKVGGLFSPGTEIRFFSNEMEVDLRREFVGLKGNVEFKGRGWLVRAQEGEIYMKNLGKKLKYYVLSDDVELLEELKGSDSSSLFRKAYGEKLEGYIREEKVVLSGNARVVQGEDVIKGSVITLFWGTDVILVDDPAARLIIDNLPQVRRKGERLLQR